MSMQLDLKISTDTSFYGQGAIPLQQNNSPWKPVTFTSRVMSDTEQSYAQVEKEALAITWPAKGFRATS